MDNIVAKSMKHVMTPSHHELFLYLKESLYGTQDEETIKDIDYAYTRLYYATQLLNKSRFYDFLRSIGLKTLASKKEQKRTDRLISAFFEAIEIFEKINNTVAVGFSYFFLAEAYLKLEDEKNSILYMEKSLALLEKEDNKMAWAVSKKLKGLKA